MSGRGTGNDRIFRGEKRDRRMGKGVGRRSSVAGAWDCLGGLGSGDSVGSWRSRGAGERFPRLRSRWLGVPRATQCTAESEAQHAQD